VKVEISRRAQRSVERIDRHWRESADYPELFRQEVGRHSASRDGRKPRNAMLQPTPTTAAADVAREDEVSCVLRDQHGQGTHRCPRGLGWSASAWSEDLKPCRPRNPRRSRGPPNPPQVAHGLARHAPTDSRRRRAHGHGFASPKAAPTDPRAARPTETDGFARLVCSASMPSRAGLREQGVELLLGQRTASFRGNLCEPA
jgi:hypothetical protein